MPELARGQKTAVVEVLLLLLELLIQRVQEGIVKAGNRVIFAS
jgi:hypothetical protein